ncbi:alpha-D-ribose 1-methylphosphonate 5-triphosphate synthase subunit PhnH [Desulfacinum hydrothermale DSM 13146]|uniref:Alpha-D-ribose 1-methylphosphonate 5-triphosphate synthase subunit PhnH n=1 Tax=Desulfacinum hydrothermale DSM 13146 TaxID=1121390 RepID=A0A1W1XI15_9BACT|nr:phosphonate C-P lyase system protein PhnH [Desulfacinum hydrothermale]SMC23633.1 alpha-D-ribose 1-methylphosphonate 5-triphosphate synthase subunit PhnH [Desulfacinum hydrothermale DSM 13146]
MVFHQAVAFGPPMGFGDPVLDSQRVFRVLLTVMSYPGRILKVTPLPQVPDGLCEASWSVLLTLADDAVSLWTDLPERSAARESIHGLCGSPVAERPGKADLVLLTRPTELEPPYDFRLGTERRPELGATIVIQAATLSVGEGFALSGPGICDESFLKVTGVPESFWAWRRSLEKEYPLGVDLILTCGASLAAIPRTTRMGE